MTGPGKVDVISWLNKNLGLLHAGAPVTIDITTPAGKRGKFRTTFIGLVPKDYVLIQFPDVQKLGSFSHYIVQGTNITVRGLIEGHEGAVVAFASPVRQTLHIPSRVMVLEFPKEVTLQTLRNNIRIETEIAVKVKIGEDYWQGNIVDLSVAGCQISLSNGDNLLLQKGQTIEVVIEDFQGIQNLKINPTICSTKTILNGVSMGLMFDDDVDTKEQVKRLLNHVVTGT